jgi:hypothetical protein
MVGSGVGAAVATTSVGAGVAVVGFAGWVQPLAATSRIRRITNPKNFFMANILISPYY